MCLMSNVQKKFEHIASNGYREERRGGIIGDGAEEVGLVSDCMDSDVNVLDKEF